MNIIDIKIEVNTPYIGKPLLKPCEPTKKLSYYFYIEDFNKFNIDLMKLLEKHQVK